jgi:hypothetical protein
VDIEKTFRPILRNLCNIVSQTHEIFAPLSLGFVSHISLTPRVEHLTNAVDKMSLSVVGMNCTAYIVLPVARRV